LVGSGSTHLPKSAMAPSRSHMALRARPRLKYETVK
jgi:hypothetical protein